MKLDLVIFDDPAYGDFTAAMEIMKDAERKILESFALPQEILGTSEATYGKSPLAEMWSRWHQEQFPL